jgi:hypothetical protein
MGKDVYLKYSLVLLNSISLRLTYSGILISVIVPEKLLIGCVSVHFVPTCQNTPPPATIAPQVVNARNILCSIVEKWTITMNVTSCQVKESEY